jgi:hypothetical protein
MNAKVPSGSRKRNTRRLEFGLTASREGNARLPADEEVAVIPRSDGDGQWLTGTAQSATGLSVDGKAESSCVANAQNDCVPSLDARMFSGGEQLAWEARLSVSTLASQLPEQIPCSDQVVVEDLTCGVQQRTDEGISNRIADADALLPTPHDVVRAENRQLLGDNRLLEPKDVLEFLNTAIAFHEQFQDANADGMCQRAKESRLEGLETLRRRICRVSCRMGWHGQTCDAGRMPALWHYYHIYINIGMFIS